MKKLIILAVTFALLLTSVAFAESFSGRVISVIDGDTVIIDRGGNLTRVTFAGIECPELDQAVGPNAKQFVTDALLGREVAVDVVGMDHDRKIVGVVKSNNINIGLELMRMGMAWYNSGLYHSKELAGIEKQVRHDGIGLWGTDRPTSPWMHRRNSRGIVAVMSKEVCNIGGRDYGTIQHSLGYGFIEAHTPPSGVRSIISGPYVSSSPGSAGPGVGSTPPGSYYFNGSSGGPGTSGPGASGPVGTWPGSGSPGSRSTGTTTPWRP